MPHVDVDMLSPMLRGAVMEEMQRYSSRYNMNWYPMSHGFKIEPPKAEAPKPAATPEKPTPASIAEDIRRLAQSDAKADLSTIPNVVETEERKRKERIVADLQSVANLAKRKEVKAKRFVLVCWRHEEAETYEGIDYAHGQYVSKEDETDEFRVFVAGDDGESPTGAYHTVQWLKDKLDRAKIPHIISYRD